MTEQKITSNNPSTPLNDPFTEFDNSSFSNLYQDPAMSKAFEIARKPENSGKVLQFSPEWENLTGVSESLTGAKEEMMRSRGKSNFVLAPK